jgi:hypothetical protein
MNLASAWAEKRRAAGLVTNQAPVAAPPSTMALSAHDVASPRARLSRTVPVHTAEIVVAIWMTPTEHALLERLYCWCAAKEGATRGLGAEVSSAIACLEDWPQDADEVGDTARLMVAYREEWGRERQTILVKARITTKSSSAVERVTARMGWSPEDAARYAIRHLCDVYDDQEDLGPRPSSPGPAFVVPGGPVEEPAAEPPWPVLSGLGGVMELLLLAPELCDVRASRALGEAMAIATDQQQPFAIIAGMVHVLGAGRALHRAGRAGADIDQRRAGVQLAQLYRRCAAALRRGALDTTMPARRVLALANPAAAPPRAVRPPPAREEPPIVESIAGIRPTKLPALPPRFDKSEPVQPPMSTALLQHDSAIAVSPMEDVAVQRDVTVEVDDSLDDAITYDRPRTRGDCAGGERPCPWVSCKHHLYVDVYRNTDGLQLNWPALEVWDLVESCALDMADRDGSTLKEIGAVMNVTRERIRQIEIKATRRISRAMKALVDDDAAPPRRYLPMVVAKPIARSSVAPTAGPPSSLRCAVEVAHAEPATAVRMPVALPVAILAQRPPASTPRTKSAPLPIELTAGEQQAALIAEHRPAKPPSRQPSSSVTDEAESA